MLSVQLLFAALVTGSVYALIATGLNVLYGTMRLLNVAHGDIAMLGAYGVFWAFTLAGIPPLFSLVGVLAATAALGAVLYFTIFRQLMALEVTAERMESNSLLVFFGISIALENLISLLFTANPRGYRYMDRIIDVGPASVTANRVIALGVALFACVCIILFFRFTMTGMSFRALVQSKSAAQLVGISVDRVHLLSFVCAFGLAGLAGGLVSMYSEVSPFMGFPYTVAAFVIIILGGLGDVFGSLVGGVILGILETFGVAWIGATFRSVLIYGIFIAIILWRPQGLLRSRKLTR